MTVERVADRVTAPDPITVLTGAGTSTESGTPNVRRTACRSGTGEDARPVTIERYRITG